MTGAGSPDPRREVERAALVEALRVSRSALGVSTPNPPVGAVVLDAAGTIVGRGATEAAGGRHAEVVALDEAGDRARGGTLVVTLEPCAHHGRTGPCTARAIADGISRVVYAVSDPTPDAAGGAETLRRAGVDAVLYDDDTSAVDARTGPLAAWLHRQSHGRPMVTWKYAASVDGHVAAADGTSMWITGPAARRHVHARREEMDVVVVGSGTLRTDDPALTARISGSTPAARQPLRAVMGLTAVPRDARVRGTDGRFRHLETRDPAAALEQLGDVNHVLIEGGPHLAGAFLAAGLVDEVDAYLAPVVLGDGLSAVTGAGVTTLPEAHRFRILETAMLGDDMYLRLTARRGTRGDVESGAGTDAGAGAETDTGAVADTGTSTDTPTEGSR